MVIWVTFFINIGFFNIFLFLGGIGLLGDFIFGDIWLGFFLGFIGAMGLGVLGFCGRKLYISI